jgi:hypothetical protein
MMGAIIMSVTNRGAADTDFLSNTRALMDTVMGNLAACSPAMRVALANRIEALARTRGELRGSRVAVGFCHLETV